MKPKWAIYTEVTNAKHKKSYIIPVSIKDNYE